MNGHVWVSRLFCTLHGVDFTVSVSTLFGLFLVMFGIVHIMCVYVVCMFDVSYVYLCAVYVSLCLCWALLCMSKCYVCYFMRCVIVYLG